MLGTCARLGRRAALAHARHAGLRASSSGPGNGGGGGGASTSGAGACAATSLGASVRAGFDAQSQPAAVAAVVAALAPAERATLLAALRVEAGAEGAGGAGALMPQEVAYYDALLQKADSRFPFGSLDSSELKAALDMHSAAQRADSDAAAAPVSARTLALLALATGIPFVGFGFLDNFVMLMAGDEIESTFGARLGLSTLAAAGLGNLVSDLCGLGAADAIENRARRTAWGRPPRLRAADRRRPAVRAARVAGSLVGVSVGCLAGMCPLLWLN